MTVDPELAGLLHHVAGAGSFAELLADPSGVQRLEAFSAGGAPYTAPDVAVRTVDVPGPNGPVPVRIYAGPASDSSSADPSTAGDSTAGASGGAAGGGLPALVWIHGGGFAGGGLDMREADQLSREVAARMGGIVLSVDYRLARDGVHFPVPHDDVLAAWLWAVEHAAELGADPRTLCLGGASAGGNLAVGAALYLKDSGRQLPAKLVLAYPFLHAELPASGNPDSAGMSGLPRILRFTADDCRALVENYIGGPLLMASSYAMPGHADPAGLPPSAVLVSEYDDLRYSAELFIRGLRSAGIAVEARLEAGATHGYLNHSAGLGIVQRGLQFLADEVGSAKPFQ
ncbi:alpha/beta hydrolase fold domain-containing protein [Arthrobacter sp. B10-11]|uniref:alpha/beta hydrolase fold domain-containing protein n=1 Tax=Arthrobacter sp. B10-11 TaxID=3081160 RepID=UPI0029553AA9|nr:alpha/beta hydrolase fold domain-containing protein [Arthrobacter sp. B10-11]MDV8147639.1 alpha/beta hydrolase fold domain-containing protein [Arthrobacter sp. B10-11]